MKTLKQIVYQLKRIADSLLMIEMTLLKTNNLKYTDLQDYSKDYGEKIQAINEKMEDINHE